MSDASLPADYYDEQPDPEDGPCQVCGAQEDCRVFKGVFLCFECAMKDPDT